MASDATRLWAYRAACWAALAAAVFLVALAYRPAEHQDLENQALAANRFNGRALRGTPVRDFSLRIAGAPRDDLRSRGSVCQNQDENISHLWGSYIGGDGFVGRLESDSFPISAPFLYIPVVGYPASAGNRLYLEVASDDPAKPVVVPCGIPNPREDLGLWSQDVSAWQGRTAKLVLEDGLTRMQGWLGVGPPIFSRYAGGSFDYVPRPKQFREACGAIVALAAFLALCAWGGPRPNI